MDEIDGEEIETLEEGERKKRESGKRGGAMEKEPNKK